MTNPSSGGPAMVGEAASTIPKKGSETFSQFLARVLDQLSLSAWLPAAALVLFVGFVVAIGAELDAHAHAAPAAVLTQALSRMAGVSLGGAVLAFVAVVVLTMLTQAFAYEAIQVLEGYWGAGVAKQFGAWRCRRHRVKRKKLVRKERELRRAAWQTAQKALRAREARRRREGLSPLLDEAMLEALRASVLERDPRLKTSQEDRLRAVRTKWEEFAQPEPVRRLNEVKRRLRDYPSPGRILPTTLGNVLRHHEDEMDVAAPGSFVIRHFDALPLALQVDHDDARNRLDLYCAMVFVLLLVAAVTVGRLWAHPWYGAAGVAICVIAAIVSYRAAVTSARWYGTILVAISADVRSRTQPATAH